MGRRRQRGRDVQGILLLDKPLGKTSNAALQRVKYLYFAKKAGHTGSLDPLADGLLPVCFGNATKVSAFLLDAEKHYRVKVKLGETNATGDSEGEILETRPTDGISEANIEGVLERFRGEIQQIPPMYSALKHKGERLYKLAREGVEVERQPRTVTIYELNLLACNLPEFELDVRCSKGTYVRTLAEDIGEALGCGAHVANLRRTGVGPYYSEGMVTMEQVEKAAEEGNASLDALLLPVDTALASWPAVHLSADTSFYLRQGQPVIVPNAPTEGHVRLYDQNEAFIGVGEILDDGRVAPRRLL
ncbi:tRNA pseudouridine(55) synthase TruB [Solemya velesiana gill symbiont]|uniref:tRNA pseudouridine synthase B n=1 Tax=Solemya velesiana gill symbiont TaxID=1918948 RepID=A0A1T2KVX1_9GAMM|nr:tRNA pseudouridine(55) synthase TruB [Solemya velesiana gill symbiont]OOZ36974.1 tRNA pseudouridine(55) synthase TruB [Solemya velesiana gill symbiont]